MEVEPRELIRPKKRLRKLAVCPTRITGEQCRSIFTEPLLLTNAPRSFSTRLQGTVRRSSRFSGTGFDSTICSAAPSPTLLMPRRFFFFLPRRGISRTLKGSSPAGGESISLRRQSPDAQSFRAVIPAKVNATGEDRKDTLGRRELFRSEYIPRDENQISQRRAVAATCRGRTSREPVGRESNNFIFMTPANHLRERFTRRAT